MWRDFTTGTWQPIVSLDSTGGYSDWKNLHFYLPQSAIDNPIQIAFYYNDFFGQGYGAAIDNLTFYEIAQPSVPGFSTDQTDLCLKQVATFTDESKGPVQSWNWDFGDGAEPRFATTKGPHQVFYSKPGKKTVKLSLNHIDHLQIPEIVSIREKPVAAMEYTRRFQDISFIDKSINTEAVLWIFGDGSSSAERNPVHTYYSKNLFEVRQIASNGTCAPDTLSITLDMRSGTGIDEAESLASLTIFPNPAKSKVSLLWNIIPQNPMDIRVISITGQLLFRQIYASTQELTLDLSDYPEGIYILQIASGKLIRNEQIIKINN